MIIKHERRKDFPMIDLVSVVGATDYVKDGEIHKNSSPVAVMVESESDLDILTEYSPGSLAYTADLKNLWQMDASGEWQEIIGEG